MWHYFTYVLTKIKRNEYGNILTEWKFLYNSSSPAASKKNMIAPSNPEGWHTSHLQIPFTEGLIHVHKDVWHSTVYNWNIRNNPRVNQGRTG